MARRILRSIARIHSVFRERGGKLQVAGSELQIVGSEMQLAGGEMQTAKSEMQVIFQ